LTYVYPNNKNNKNNNKKKKNNKVKSKPLELRSRVKTLPLTLFRGNIVEGTNSGAQGEISGLRNWVKMFNCHARYMQGDSRQKFFLSTSKKSARIKIISFSENSRC
jgi:hypothetical protein